MPAIGAAPAIEPVTNDEEEIAAKVSCDACYFGVSNLCTLPRADFCATYRPQSGILTSTPGRTD